MNNLVIKNNQELEYLNQYSNNLGNFTKEEINLLNIPRTDIGIYTNDTDYKNLTNVVFSKLPGCHIDSQKYGITLDYCATNIIHSLFEKYVDDDTLVITSNCEHDCVKSKLKDCKNTLILDYYLDIKRLQINNIIKKSKSFKKLFIFIIGTHIATGEITPQLFFTLLKNELDKINANYKLIIDDAQGMFIVPRNYSIFDYIINTAHVLVEGYDMGILISKNMDIGYKYTNWLDDYINRLDIMLLRLRNISNFKFIMSECFAYYLSKSEDYNLPINTAPNIFSINTNGEYFSKEFSDYLYNNYKISIQNPGDKHSTIRIRAAHILRNTEKVLQGVKILIKELDHIDKIRLIKRKFNLIGDNNANN